MGASLGACGARESEFVQGAQAHPLCRQGSLAAHRRRQGRVGDKSRKLGRVAAAGGIGTVSAVNADSYDAEGRSSRRVTRR
jgi:hypothetical protein